MNRTRTFIRPLLLGLVAALALTACNDADPDKPGRQVKSRAGEGREETKLIRNTENIGYAGNAIAKKVDKAIEINEDRPEELDKRLDGQDQ